MSQFSEKLFKSRFKSRLKQFEGIPGPTPTYPLGTLGEFRGKRPWEVCAEYGKKYGGITLIWIGGRPTLVLNDPHLISEVLITKHQEYYKDYPIKALMPVLKKTLFNLNAPKLTELRKPHNHPLLIEGYDDWLQSQFSVIKKVVDRHVSSMIASGNDIDLIDQMQRIFFDIHNTVVCGPNFEDGGFENFYAISVMATDRMKVPQSLLVPPIKPSFHKAMRLHYGAYERAVEKARQNPDPEANDLLSIFLRQGTEIPDAQIVDFVSEFHAGGNISAAAGVVNTLQLLNDNPKIAQQLYGKLAESTRGDQDYDSAAVSESTLLDNVLRESLRIIPPVAVYGRSVLRDRNTILGEHELPPNTAVLICAETVQRSASHWKDPDTFDPGRWANGGVAANPIGSDYFFPFGRGPRICAGAEMAMLEMKIVLASLLSKAEVTTSGPFEGILHCGVVETPELKARLKPHPVA